MPIDYRTDSNWKSTTTDVLKQAEGFRSRVYDDGKGIPTMGYGFALVRDNGQWEVVDDAKLQAAGLEPPGPGTQRLLRQIARDKNAGQDTSALVDQLSGANSPWQVTESQAGTLLDGEVEVAETALENRLQNHLGPEEGTRVFN
ncbi:MAG: hypothetical protein ABEK42_01700, partial [Thiohalorhabdaceae bacterium]